MKNCPFCAEEIQDAAIKCRFCGSTLEGALPAPAHAPLVASAPTSLSKVTFFEGVPSWKAWFWSYVAAGILSLVFVGLLWIAYLEFLRKSTRYRISDRTIDYERGVFSRQIETLQLWRVRDIDFRQSGFERVLGIARIHVFTNDVSDPELVLEGLPASRELFDQLKDAADLARQQRVVGLVQ